MAPPTKLQPPTPGGKKLRSFLVKKFGSIPAGARAAGLCEPTVRRYIYDPPKRPALSAVTALEGIGAERAWLLDRAV